MRTESLRVEIKAKQQHNFQMSMQLRQLVHSHFHQVEEWIWREILARRRRKKMKTEAQPKRKTNALGDLSELSCFDDLEEVALDDLT